MEQYLRGSPYQGRETTLLGEYAKSPNSYSVFLQGDYPLTKITTNIKNGRKIAVVKESFGNAFSPFLVNHYEDCLLYTSRSWPYRSYRRACRTCGSSSGR